MRILCNINTQFYRTNAASFSATRTAPWEGWEQCACVLGEKAGGKLGGKIDAKTGKAEKLTSAFSVFDMACGNLRFEQFLTQRFPCAAFAFYAVDNCPSLLPDTRAMHATSVCTSNAPTTNAHAPNTHVPNMRPSNMYEPNGQPSVQVDTLNNLAFFKRDIIEGFLRETNFEDGKKIGSMVRAPHHNVPHRTTTENPTAPEQETSGEEPAFLKDVPLCDLSVSFGFMHHVPAQALRQVVLQALVDKTAPGGLVMCSFWQFLHNETLARKAQHTHEEALAHISQHVPGFRATELEENDYFLGWKYMADQYRYCHSFTDREIDEIVSGLSTAVSLVAKFSADGRSHNLNSYIILRKR